MNRMNMKSFKFNLTLKQRLERLFRGIFSMPVGYIAEKDALHYGFYPLGMWIEDKINDIEEAINGYWIGVKFE